MTTADVGVLGAGAFGTALAVTLAQAGRRIALWGRSGAPALPGVTPAADLGLAAAAPAVLVAVPAQALRDLLTQHAGVLTGRTLILCCKGIEARTGLLPTQIVDQVLPGNQAAVLTGPGFAADIARGLPTALTLATTRPDGAEMQARLATPALRPYLSDDVVGAQLGGALKNVVAIGAGIVTGAGLGDSARASLMTRGFAEMVRLATARGARAQTLFGLSGFGDLVLTCTSDQSRNFRHGMALGAGRVPAAGATVEGAATARAVVDTAGDLDLPVTRMVAALLAGALPVRDAVEALMTRPLKREGWE